MRFYGWCFFLLLVVNGCSDEAAMERDELLCYFAQPIAVWWLSAGKTVQLMLPMRMIARPLVLTQLKERMT